MPRLPAACLAFALLHQPAMAAFPCDELWGERNAIYFEAGYCFKTERARKAFGDNAGCKYDNVADLPLTARNRADIADIQRRERENNCPR
ncbi:YARHG domain-containing protein [Bosea sp. Tri-44]|uniref:YARHG domain-containing protein n=1 Tax=Bosea sp. Tri-44 TaxID=1972137 RepID=UPI00100DE4EB|nr:YARHG domain-containing protein [Bosea sp. Tri-44]RXT48112.1 YARHG domain-containing protein [Bosea sp. Tri-44]